MCLLPVERSHLRTFIGKHMINLSETSLPRFEGSLFRTSFLPWTPKSPGLRVCRANDLTERNDWFGSTWEHSYLVSVQIAWVFFFFWQSVTDKTHFVFKNVDLLCVYFCVMGLGRGWNGLSSLNSNNFYPILGSWLPNSHPLYKYSLCHWNLRMALIDRLVGILITKYFISSRFNYVY